MTDKLPATTLVYAGWSPGAAMQTTMLARMLADQRITRPWQNLLHHVMPSLPQQPLGANADAIASVLDDAAQCEGCFALLDMKPGKHGFEPQAILIINLGAKHKVFEDHFKPLQDTLQRQLGDDMHMLKLQGSWLWSATENDKVGYTWGFLGDSFVVYLGDGGEKFLANMNAGKLDAPLVKAPAFIDCMDHLPGASVFTTYADAGATLDLFHAVLDKAKGSDVDFLVANWNKMLTRFGLDNLRSIGQKTAIQNEQFVTRTLLRTSSPPHGLLPILAAGPVDDAMLKGVPTDAMFAAGMRLDLAATYTQIKDTSLAIGGNDAKTSFDDLERAGETAGMPVKQLLAALGDQWVIYNAQSTGSFFLTGWTLLGQVRDPQKLANCDQALVKLLTGAGDEHGGMHEYEADSVKIHYYQAGGFFNPVSPAWAIVGDRLIFALYPQTVEDAAAQLKAELSLLDNPEFAAVRKRLGDQNPNLFFNMRQVVHETYPLLLVVANMAGEQLLEPLGAENPNGNGAPDITLLPSMQRLLRYVGAEGMTAQTTPDGLLYTQTVANPLLSPLSLGANALPFWIAASLPSLVGAQENATRVKSAANLRQIGQALAVYAGDNQDKLPPDLDTLVKAQILPKDALKSPLGDAAQGPDFVYLYFKGMDVTVGADTVVVYDAAALEQGDGCNLLYGDGHVEWLNKEEAAKTIDKAKADAAAKVK